MMMIIIIILLNILTKRFFLIIFFLFSWYILQPVYIDPVEQKKEFYIPRSQSCPHLFMDDDDNNNDEDEATIIPNIKQRERAFSEHCIKFRHNKRHSGGGGVNSISSMTLNRPISDSELSHIDKEKTFDAQRATVEPGELLAKVAMSLAGFQMYNNSNNNNENMLATVTSRNGSMFGVGGIHGFSDSQILESEDHYSDWSLGTSEKSFITPVYRRSRRAFSEVRIPIEESVKVRIMRNFFIKLLFYPPIHHSHT